MSRWPVVFAVALTATVLAVASAWAQTDGGGGGRRGMRGGAGGGGLFLLRNEQVQKDLQLTDDQKQKIQALTGEARGNPQDAEKQLAEILKPTQLERLKQIRLQMQGAAALANPDVAKALELTDDQKEKLKTIQEQAREAMRGAAPGNVRDMTPEQRTEMRQKMEQSRKEVLDKAMAVLTPQQKEKLEKMQGAKLTLDLSTLRPQRGAGKARAQ